MGVFCGFAQFALLVSLVVGLIKPSLFLKKKLPVSRRLIIVVGCFLLMGGVAAITPEEQDNSLDEVIQKHREEAQAEREADSVRHVVSSCDVAVRHYLKGTLNDPDSYEAVSWTRPVRVDGGYVLVHKYRAKNGFGAKVLATNTFKLDNNFNIIKVQ